MRFLENFKKGFTPRSQQTEVIDFIDDEINLNKTKFIIAQCPTGVGKSLIAHACAQSMPEMPPAWQNLVDGSGYGSITQEEDFWDRNRRAGAYVLTVSKSLQDQYGTEFKDAIAFKGKSNYACAINDLYNCEFAPCSVDSNQLRKCSGDSVCHYYNKKKDLLTAKMGILNYSAFLSLRPVEKHRRILILDECSEIEKSLVGHFTVDFEYRFLDRLGVNYKKLVLSKNNDLLEGSDLTMVVGWINRLNDELVNCLQIGSDITKLKKEQMMGHRLAKNYIDKIVNLQKMMSAGIIVEYSAQGVRFVPYNIKPLCKSIFDHADHIILMSATIVDVKNYAKNLGIDRYAYIDVDTPFDAKKSPIHVNNKYFLNATNLEAFLPKIVKTCKTILNSHATEKGIIHTHTNKITDYLDRNLNEPRVLSKSDLSNNEKIIKEHYENPEPTVLMSPSLSFGLDLKGDMGRFQIIVKCPYPSLGDHRTKKKFEENPLWYKNEMLTTLIQACGRTTRTESDESITYILDANLRRVLEQERDKLPKYFLDRIS